ncbi:MAG: DNA mismatch repair protein MutT, partial [Treponema sp.]|nr:DNA mismatch repair protein MutT [Treponema sp.]
WDPGPLVGSFGVLRRAGPGDDPAAEKAGNCELFASFPNTYPYKGVTYNTCDMFFFLDAPDLSEADLHIDTDELAGLRFIKSADVKLDDLAFDSTRRALKAYLDLIHQEN